MQIKTVDLVIFDCDGVLIDSEVLSMETWQTILSRYNIPLSKDYFIEHFLGKSMEHVQFKLKEDFMLTLTTAMKEDFYTLLFKNFEHFLQQTPGIESVLSALTIPFCIATSSSPERTAKALNRTGLHDFFEGRVYTRSLVKRGKPAPDLFLYAANSLGVDPANCLVIEDSQPGISAAKSAGMHYLHYTGGAHLHSGNTSSDHTIKTWDELYRCCPNIFDVRNIK